MTISIEHFSPDPIILINYLTTDDVVQDERKGTIAISNYKRKFGGRIIAIWDMSLSGFDFSKLVQKMGEQSALPSGYFDGLTTIIIGEGDLLELMQQSAVDEQYHGQIIRRVSTRREAIDIAYQILAEEGHNNSFSAASR